MSGISDKELGERMQVADQILEVQGESVGQCQSTVCIIKLVHVKIIF